MAKGGSSLRYVGSPYQTSLSEAGQAKFLYCLGSTQSPTPSINGVNKIDTKVYWKEMERWKIDVGKKYFKVKNNAN